MVPPSTETSFLTSILMLEKLSSFLNVTVADWVVLVWPTTVTPQRCLVGRGTERAGRAVQDGDRAASKT